MKKIIFFIFISFIISNSYSNPPGKYIYDPIFNSHIYVEEHGKKNSESILLIHGIGERGLKDWESLITILKNNFHVLAFDLPGFGKSKRKNDFNSPLLYIAFIKSLTDKFIKNNYYVIGHSLGGTLSAAYAATYPKNIKKLIIIDAAGILERTAISKHYSKKYINENIPKIMSKPINILEEIADNAIDILQNVPFELDLILGSKIARDTIFGDNIQGAAGVSLIDTDFTSFLKQINIPTLILWGENDQISPKRVGKILNFTIPTSELDIIKEASHNPMLEKSDYINKRIFDFLTQKIKTKPFKLIKKTQSNIDLNINNENEKTYSGSYKIINISNSKEINLHEISADEINISNSFVSIENSNIDSKQTALKSINSKVTITASKIIGKNIIQSINSSIDIGGVIMIGKESGFFVDNHSTVIFSICEIKSPELNGYLHKTLR